MSTNFNPNRVIVKLNSNTKESDINELLSDIGVTKVKKAEQLGIEPDYLITLTLDNVEKDSSPKEKSEVSITDTNNTNTSADNNRQAATQKYVENLAAISGSLTYPDSNTSGTKEASKLLESSTNLSSLENSLETTLDPKNHRAECSCEGCRSLLINKYPLAPAPVLGSTVSPGSLPLLSSNPSAAAKIFLDFNGHTTSGTTWNSKYNDGADIVTPAYSIDADTTTFSTTEVASIEEIWKRVAEDYAPFNVDVTTVDPGNLSAAYNIRAVIGGSWDQWYEESGGAGGVAFLNSWRRNDDIPVFVFEENLANGEAKSTAEAISHEVGHSLGLYHQSQYDDDGNKIEDYHPGFGSGDTGWAPIMGRSYDQNLTTWHNGTSSLGYTSYQDDMSIISASNNGFGGYRLDDRGNTISSATALSGTTTLTGSGVIEQTSDIDVFSFQTGAGAVNFTINPAQYGPNLDISAELLNSSGTIIASSNPSNTLSASFNSSVSAGTYFIAVKSNGEYGRVGQYTISGTASDNIAPIASSFTPADDATEVAVGDNLVVNFNENIQKGTGNIVILKLSDDSLVETISVTDSNVTVSGSELTINPSADLAQGTDYYVEIANGAIEDLAGNNYAGITGNSAWNFQTADNIAPIASSFTPADDATEVAVGDNLVVNFNEDIQKGTGNIVIKKLSDDSLVETISVTDSNVTVSGSELTINPSADLAQGTDYYVEIANGAIQDLAGNNYAGITGNSAWNFTTVDNIAPIASSFTPADDATEVAVGDNLVVNFNENIQKGTGNIVIKKLSDDSLVETISVTDSNVTVSGSELIINPSADLAQGTDYYVEIANGAIQDLAGNNYAGITGNSTWNFQTADNIAPIASSFTPADDATEVAVGDNLVVNFNENIQKGTGNIVIKKLSDDSLVETISVTDSNVTVSGSQLTINPSADLAQGTDYYVEIANGAIEDLAGNNYAGITGNSAWNFTTVDNIAPIASSFTPADDATEVAVGDNLVVNFNEDIQKGTGNIVIKKLSDDSLVETISVTASNVTVSGSQLIINPINPSADLAQGTDYYVEIANGAIQDLAGNNYAGITGNSTWNFTTTSPTILNDNFVDAIELTGNSVNTTGTNVGATGEIGEPDQSKALNSVWWSWTATSDGTVTIDTFGSDFDTYLSAFTGNTVDNLSWIAFNDDTNGVQSQISFDAIAGTTYQIAVDGYGSATGEIQLNLDVPSPVNDNFADAIELTGNSVNTTGTNVGATGEIGEPYQSGDINSAWWSWTASSDGTVVIDTFGSNFDTYLSAFTGNTVDNLSWIASNDDTNGVQSQISFDAIAGTTYKIAVDGYSSDTGEIQLNLELNDSLINGTPGKIDRLTQGGAAMNAPNQFTRAANSAAASLQNVFTPVFTDADGALAGNQALRTNSEALVVATNGSIAGTDLVINDQTAGFQAGNDLVVDLTGYTETLLPQRNINADNLFV